jgi:hypothetical protein
VALDGRMDEPFWKGVLAQDTFYQTSPGVNVPPSRRTELKVFHTGTSLVVGIRCFEPNTASIQKNRYRRDEVPDDAEGVHLYLDPAGTAQRAVWIYVTPKGDMSDGITDYTQGTADSSEDFEFRCATAILPGEYDIELEIPFASLPMPHQTSMQTWGIALYREVPRTNLETLSLVPRDTASSDPRVLFARMTLAGIRPGAKKPWNLLPTWVGSYTTEDDQVGDQRIRTITRKGSPELTGWWSPDPATRATFTINPDFSQVEADAIYQRVNNRYPVYIAEKRPFFLDAYNPFGTPFSLVNTRNIVNPFAGLRFSSVGKSGGLFLMSALERNTPPDRFGLPSDQAPRDTTWFAGRGRWDPAWGETGLMVTSMDHGPDGNQVAAWDAAPRFGNLGLNFQAVQSWSRLGDPVTTRGSGLDGSADYKATSWLSFGGSYQTLSPTFTSVLGYIPETDFRKSTLYVALRDIPKDTTGFLKEADFTFSGEHKTDTSGRPLKSLVEVDQTYTFAHRILFMFTLGSYTEHYMDQAYPLHVAGFFLAWSEHPPFQCSLTFNRGTTLIYNPANPRAGDMTQWAIQMSHTLSDLTLGYQVMNYRVDDPTAPNVVGELSWQATATYVFGHDMSLRVQRTWDRARWKDDDLENPHTQAQILFTYQPSAFRRFYLGYNDVRNEDRTLLERIFLDSTDNRQFFMKAALYFQ